MTDRADQAVCIVGPPGPRLGVDLELVEEATRSSATTSRRGSSGSSPRAAASASATCSRTSSGAGRSRPSRCCGRACVATPAASRCSFPDEPHVDGWAALAVRAAEGAVFPGWWRRYGEFVLTMAATERFSPPRPTRRPARPRDRHARALLAVRTGLSWAFVDEPVKAGVHCDPIACPDAQARDRGSPGQDPPVQPDAGVLEARPGRGPAHRVLAELHAGLRDEPAVGLLQPGAVLVGLVVDDLADARLDRLLGAAEAGAQSRVEDAAVRGVAVTRGHDDRVLLGVDADAGVVARARRASERSGDSRPGAVGDASRRCRCSPSR